MAALKSGHTSCLPRCMSCLDEVMSASADIGAVTGTPNGRIVFDRVTKDFGKQRAVDSLSFTVEPGSVTGFLGPNGAGKTTTLRMLLGLIAPTSGTATING